MEALISLVLGMILVVIGYMTAIKDTEDKFRNQCDLTGMVIIDKVVYECKKKEVQ